MSLNSALNNAFSGLTANARAATVVSNNISNALTDGYGRRELSLSSNRIGGVWVNGVERVQDPVLLADRRLSDAGLASANTWQSFAKEIEFAVGQSGDPSSLSGRLLSFENALITAAGNPASTQRLQAVAQNATAFANELNGLSTKIQSTRENADRAIAIEVDNLNANLGRLEQLNTQIEKATVRNRDVAPLLDERQLALDAISSVVPLRVVARENGKISVFSMGGAQLLDPKAAVFEFSQTNVISPSQTQANGQLSGLTINGIAVKTDQTGMFAGGRLAVQFEIRDETAPSIQAQLDGIARDLIARLGPGGPDVTIAPGSPGLFTDSGVAFDPLNEVGIAARISLNATVNPQTGDLWRLRDGLGAVAPGEVGDATLLQSISSTLGDLQTPGSASLDPQAKAFEQHISTLSSEVAGFRVRAEAEQGFQSGRQTALKEIELAAGVDTDMELQDLLQIEQNYAANARMMSVVDELLERLLSI